MSDLFFHDPATGDTIAYFEVWRELVAGASHPPRRVATRRPAEAVRALVLAVLARRPLVLVDPDFDPGDDVIPSPNPVSLPHASPADLDAALTEAQTGEGFSLTLYTSGTTGRSRRVTHRLDGLVRNLRTGARHAADVWALTYHSAHIAGVQVVLQALFNRNPLINVFGLAPEAAARAIVQHGVTHLSATPSFYRLLLAALSGPLPAVRAVTLGGERADGRLVEKLRAAFPAARVRNLYASTEAGTLFASDGEFFEVPSELEGRVRIREGLLELHGSLLGEVDDSRPPVGGWYATGDRVEIVGENPIRFRVLGRDRDWINVGGLKVDPAEPEDALRACPGVIEARVFGRPNSVLGQVLCAEVVIEGVLDEVELRRRLAERLPPAKVPRIIRQVPSLPRGRTGKLVRPAQVPFVPAAPASPAS